MFLRDGLKTPLHEDDGLRILIEVVGSAVPVVTPASLAVKKNTIGKKP